MRFLKMSRFFSMPTRNTFSIKVVESFVRNYIYEFPADRVVVDPFCGKSLLGTLRNDINKGCETASFHQDAIEFLGGLANDSADVVLLDPPYSPRQIAESYAGRGGSWDGRHPAFMARIRDHAARITRSGGVVLSFGWNSTGLGAKRGFDLIELMLVNHGGSHNDTICIAERKGALDVM